MSMESMDREEGIVEQPPSVGVRHSLTRRTFLHTSILGVSGLALASCTRGIMDRNEIEITHRTFRLPNLPLAWDGKTITFLSDIHSGQFMDVEDLKRVVKI